MKASRAETGRVLARIDAAVSGTTSPTRVDALMDSAAPLYRPDYEPCCDEGSCEPPLDELPGLYHAYYLGSASVELQRPRYLPWVVSPHLFDPEPEPLYNFTDPNGQRWSVSNLAVVDLE